MALLGSPKHWIISHVQGCRHPVHLGNLPQRVLPRAMSDSWSGIQMCSRAPRAMPRGMLLMVHDAPHSCLPQRHSNGPSAVITPLDGIGPRTPHPGHPTHGSSSIFPPTRNVAGGHMGTRPRFTLQPGKGTSGPAPDESACEEWPGSITMSVTFISAAKHAVSMASSSLSIVFSTFVPTEVFSDGATASSIADPLPLP